MTVRIAKRFLDRAQPALKRRPGKFNTLFATRVARVNL